MDIKLYYTNSPNNKIGKHLDAEVTFSGSLRDTSKMLNPEVMIETNSLNGFNYAYIPQFNRYYFIKEIESYRTGLWVVKMEVDVLESYKASILNLDCIIEATEDYMANDYLSDSESWVTSVKAKTDILNFNSGLLDSGEYILITAGG